MLKDILVCLEGSPSSDAAIRAAIEIARTCKARLSGLAIVDEPDIRAGAASGIGGSSFKHERDEMLLADARRQADLWVSSFERRCREAGVSALTVELVGRPAETILVEMERRELTVIGRDANFRFETETDDVRTREAILHRATQPVLLVPELADPKLGPDVVIAYDGSGAAKRALASFAASGLARSRKIHVVTVDDNGDAGWEMASRGVELLSAGGITAKPHNIVSAMSNVDALFQLATSLAAGMIVMGSVAHSRLKELFKGSVTQGLVEKSIIPLYLQR